MNNSIDNSISGECEQMLAAQFLALTGETLDSVMQARLADHLKGCAACRTSGESLSATHTTLQNEFGALQLSAGFTAKTLAALPALKPVAAPAGGPKVFAAIQPRTSWAVRLMAAAAVLLFVGLAWVTLVWKNDGKDLDTAANLPVPDGKIVAEVKRGVLCDSTGRAVKQLALNTNYSVVEESIIPLSDTGMVKMQQGAEFQLQVGAVSGAPTVRLAQGDLYASGNGTGEAVRVQCTNFETELHQGDAFVAEQGPRNMVGVVIVFNGMIEIKSPTQGSIALTAGQVYVSSAENAKPTAQTLLVADVAAIKEEAAGMRGQNIDNLKVEYAKRVDAYQKELVALEQQIDKTAKNGEQAELRDRRQRIGGYLSVHQRRLTLLTNANRGSSMPFRVIERGLAGYSDPVTWLH